MEGFGRGTFAMHGKQSDVCVCSRPMGGEMPFEKNKSV